MTANKPMTGEQLDELMTVAVNMQRDSEKSGDRPTAMFAYAVQVAVLELRKASTDFSALAAENAGLKNAITAVSKSSEECEINGDELKYVVEPSEFDALTDFLDETPATDAFLAEVRASAIDSLVDIKTKQLADMHPDTHAFGATAMSIRSQINELQVFAAQLRKGVQS